MEKQNTERSSPAKGHNYLCCFLTSVPENSVMAPEKKWTATPWQTNITWKDTPILPQRELSPFMFHLTVHWEKENTKIFQELLDMWSNVASTFQEPKHHHGPPVSVGIRRSSNKWSQVKWLTVYHLVLRHMQ